LDKKTCQKTGPEENENKKVIAKEEFNESINEIDFGAISNLLKYIFALLKRNPIFYDKDFKSLMICMYNH